MCSLSGELLPCQRLNGSERVGGGRRETSRAGEARRSKGRRKAGRWEYGCARHLPAPHAPAPCGTPSAALPSVGSASVLCARPGSRLHGSPTAVTAKLPCAGGLATRGTDRCLVDGNLSNVPTVAYLCHARDVVRLSIPLYFGLLAAVALSHLWLEAPECYTERR